MLGYSKQAYYKRFTTIEKEEFDEALVLELIKAKRKIWKKGSGRNLHASLQEDFTAHGIKMGRDKFYKVLGRNNLLNARKRYKTRTTYSYHHFHKYPNLIKDIEPIRPNQVIVSDITYIWLREIENFSYLYLITDMYSRKILGYNLSEDLKASSAIKALKMALGKMSSIKDCTHHSDRGIQYCSHQYTKLLKKNEILISMTENGDPLENPIAERINRTIKEEFTEERYLSFRNISEGKEKIKGWVEFYNEERPHRSIEMLTPSKAYQLNGELKKMWKNYYGKNYSIHQLADG
ncbi:MAG TPA: IS3 family transposase [Bacteroidales bacterium]|nr:IS3 family transposase [Bacteroidales bacterium]